MSLKNNTVIFQFAVKMFCFFFNFYSPEPELENIQRQKIKKKQIFYDSSKNILLVIFLLKFVDPVYKKNLLLLRYSWKNIASLVCKSKF